MSSHLPTSLVRPNSSRSSAILTVGSTALILTLNVITGILAARALGPAGRGQMTILGLWSPFVASITTLGMPSAVNVLIKRGENPACVFATSALVATAAGTAAGIAAALVLMRALSGSYSPSQVLFAELCVLTVPFNLLLALSGAYYQAVQHFVAYNTLRVFPPLFTIVALLVLDLTTGQTPERAILAYLGPSSFIGLGAAIFIIGRRGALTSGRLAAELLHYGLRAYGAEVVGSVGSSADRLLMALRMSTPLLGIFFVARSTADALMGLQVSFAAVLLPRVAGAARIDAARLAAFTARVGFAMTASAALVIGTCAPELIRLVYGEQFLGATALFRLLLAEVLLTGAAQTLGQAYLGCGRPGTLSLIQIISVVTTAVVLAIILPKAGLGGAGVALVVIAALRFLIVWFGFPLWLAQPLPRLWLNFEDVRLVLGQRHLTKISLLVKAR
jgi:O-antigen/teichoic acid export membrane protein